MWFKFKIYFFFFSGTLYANKAKIINPRVDVSGKGVMIILDDYLFPLEVKNNSDVDGTTTTTTATITTTTTTFPITDVLTTMIEMENANEEGSNSTFFQNLVDLLSFFKNGVRVFQHFLSRSNVSLLLKNGIIDYFILLL